MEENNDRLPEGPALERALAEHGLDPAGLVLRLAWRAGLTRDEIHSLAWEQVDAAAGLLRLPDRAVPLEEETAAFLERWRQRCARFSPYVAASDRTRRRMTPQTLSALARAALDAAGQPGVRLSDLRRDFVRRQLREHDWPYVLRVSGMSLAAYRNGAARASGPAEAAEPRGGAEARLAALLERERTSPAGLALWLAREAGLRGGEIAALTWDRVDLAGAALRLPDRDAPLSAALRDVLAEAAAERGPGGDPHVVLTPRSRGPVSPQRLSALAREALVRAGLDRLTLASVRADPARAEDAARILEFAEARGSVSRGEAAALLGASPETAARRLAALEEAGTLVRAGNRCYPAGRVLPPERWRGEVRAFLARSGPAYCQDVAALLGVGRPAAARLLKRMVAEGELTLSRATRQYNIV